MPNSLIDLLHRFLKQNGGELSERGRAEAFALLTDAEVEAIEAAYAQTRAALNFPPEDPNDGAGADE